MFTKSHVQIRYGFIIFAAFILMQNDSNSNIIEKNESLAFVFSGVLSSGDVSAVCQPETVLPQQMASLPQQLPFKSEGNLRNQLLN